MNKTPVSILQEMMVKKCLVPNYELIHNGGGTHMNIFTYQVSCDGLSATGTGRCKKDAKHEAAKAMLETIAKANGYPQLPASPAPSPIHTPFPTQIPASTKPPANVPFINAIGALQEICVENNLGEPQYESISDVGPPHARVFTIHCVVSTFREEGVATTKKQAKHDAAKKMLDRITDVVDGKMQDISLYLPQEIPLDCTEMNEVAKRRYPDLTKLPVVKKPNLGVYISQYHSRLKDTVEEKLKSETVDKLVDLLNEAKLKSHNEALYEKLLDQFRELLVPLNIELQEILLQSSSNCGYLRGISLDTTPALVELNYAEDKTEANIGALIKMINALHLLFL